MDNPNSNDSNGNGNGNGNLSPTAILLTKPSDYWKSLLEEWKVPILDTVGIEQDDDSSSNPDNNVVFLETTSDRVEAYQNFELQTAVRRRDLVTLKKIAAEKHASDNTNSTMNACNRFGESILHLACRKGSLDVVQLLVSTETAGCGCSLLVRDDYGRTVLHDACWTVNPPWELIKLILKKAPVLWRVSDVRGHLALQYVPKSAWPQWAAFLSKNKELLQRIMVHSYHQIDILQQQQQPQQSQQQQSPQERVKQETFNPTVLQDSSTSTNDASAVTPQTLPQHKLQQQQQQQRQRQQKQQQQQQQHHAIVTVTAPAPTTVSLPVSTHNSAEQLPAPTTTFSLGASSGQARSILARALAQANPAMVQAISQSQGQPPPQQQGLSRFANPSKGEGEGKMPTTTTSTSTSTTMQEQQPQAAAPVAPAPGPATAALDEALRAMSANRCKVRSSFLLTDQQGEAEDENENHHNRDCGRDRPRKANANASNGNHHRAPNNDDGSQVPLPYAPSISMIAARLGRYQQTSKNNKNNAAVAAAATTPPSNTRVASQGEDEDEQESSPSLSSPPTPPRSRNPLPAVPNPLLAASETCAGQHPSGRSQEQQGGGVPSSITTRTKKKNSHSESMVPNPMVAAALPREQDTRCHGGSGGNSINNGNNSNSNSDSSVTGSASPSTLVETVSEATMNATTDTDSDRVISTSSSNNPSPRASFPNEVATMPEAATRSTGNSGVEGQAAGALFDLDETNSNKHMQDAISKRTVG
jgi:hypothetical protein